jgi:hypothetical protein
MAKINLNSKKLLGFRLAATAGAAKVGNKVGTKPGKPIPK